jgi:RNA polymerase sigma-70 factor (ECF subfamily)
MTHAPTPTDNLLPALLPLVLTWCLRLGGGRIDAEAAAQDALLVLFRRREDLRPGAPIEPWAWGVTLRVVRDHRRRAWLRRWLPGEPPDWGHDQSPERCLGDRQRAQAVQKVLDALSEDHRIALVLCDAEERTTAEAAQILDLPHGTVKSRLRAARAAFRSTALELGLLGLPTMELDHV